MDPRLKTFLRIAPCLLAIIVDYAGFGLVYPLVSAMFTETHVEVFPYIHALALKNFYLSLAYLLYPLGMFFGASFLGDLSDAHGRKKVLELAMMGIFLSFMLMAFGVLFHLLSIFLLGRLLSGLMAGSQPLSQAAVADVSTSENKASNMSIVMLTNCVGVIFGPLIAGLFSSQLFIKEFGFSVPFFIAAFLALIAFFWILLGFKETYLHTEKAKIDWTRPLRIFVEALKKPNVRFLSLIVLLFQFGLALYYQMVAIYLIHQFGYTSFKVGIFYGFLGIFFAAGILWIFPYAIKNYSLPLIAFFGLFINGLMVAVTGLTPIEVLVWIWTIPLAIFNVIGYTSLLTIFSNSADPSRQGWIMGVFAACVAIAFILAGLSANLLPWLAAPWQLVMGGGVIVLSSLLTLRFLRKN